MSFYGLTLHLQHLGTNVFLFQIFFGVVTLLANYIALLALNHLGRRMSQILFMLLLGLFFLSIIFVPQGEERAQVEGRQSLPCAPSSQPPPLPHGMYLHLRRLKGEVECGSKDFPQNQSEDFAIERPGESQRSVNVDSDIWLSLSEL